MNPIVTPLTRSCSVSEAEAAGAMTHSTLSTSDPTMNAVNGRLTVPAQRLKPAKAIENKEFAGFARRIIKAHAKRVAGGDVEALADLVALSHHVDYAITDAVQGLRAFGYSWSEIARPLGMTKQAAQQRWGGDRP